MIEPNSTERQAGLSSPLVTLMKDEKLTDVNMICWTYMLLV